MHGNQLTAHHAHVHTAPEAPRTLVLRHGTSVQRLKFFPGGPRDDLLAAIREVLGVANDAPLRFRDDDGDMVAVSPAGMPSGTVLYVSIEHGILDQAQHPHAHAACAPDAGAHSAVNGQPQADVAMATSTSAPPPTQQLIVHQPAAYAPAVASWRRWERADGGAITADGLHFSVGDGSPSHSEGWSVCTPPLPTAGQHYLAISFPSRPCCVAFGVVPASTGIIPHRNIILDRDYPHMVSLQGVGKGPAGAVHAYAGGAGAMDVGVFVDTAARVVVIVPHHDPHNAAAAIRMDGVPLPLVVAMASPKHGIRATILPGAGLPPGAVFAVSGTCYTKGGSGGMPLGGAPSAY